jgi:hypothetical protein
MKISTTIRASFFALILLAAGTAASNAQAAVCRLGGYWDAFPVFIGADGSCQSRAGWYGYMTPY